MSLIGGEQTGLGNVPTASGPDSGGGFTLGSGMDLALSYGHGVPGTDDLLPSTEGAFELWLSPTLTAPLAEPGQVREWLTPVALAELGILARIDAAQINWVGAVGTTKLVVTVDGSDTGIEVIIPPGTTADLTLSVSGLATVNAGSKVGLAFSASGELDTGSALRCEARLLAGETAGSVSPPVPPPSSPAPGMRFWWDLTKGVTRSTTNITGIADQSGNGFNLTDVGLPPGSRHLQYNPTGINGLPSASGTQDFTPQSLIYTASNIFTGGQPRTIFAVVKPGGTSMFGRLGGYIMAFRRSAPEFGIGLETVGGTDQRIYTDFTTVISAAAAVDYSHTPILLRWQTDAPGTHLFFYVNGVLTATGPNVLGGESGNVGAIFGSLINDDGGQVFEGDSGEALGYVGLLSDADVTRNEAYLRNKWSLP